MATPNFKNYIDGREWDALRDAWLAHVPVFPEPGAKPDPGIERLGPLQQVQLPDRRERFHDIPGLRMNMLWEGVFLFHKCAHSHLAAQRLGHAGMHGWAMFNAYHSAYLGARGVMALLGLGFPYLAQGGQLLVDVYSPPETSKEQRQLKQGDYTYEEFVVTRLPRLDQQDVWNAFLRTLRVAEVDVWDTALRDELTALTFDRITGPRNSFLYKAAYWPTPDLISDANEAGFDTLLSVPLDPDAQGFLLRLSCDVYRLFEQLVSDLAVVSAPIRDEIAHSRLVRNPQVEELVHYHLFLSAVAGASTAAN